jgi:serine O-acetyltransferase
MNTLFFQSLLQKHQESPEVASTKVISNWANRLMQVLFPEITEHRLANIHEIQNEISLLRLELIRLLYHTKSCKHENNNDIANTFFDNLPSLYSDLQLDINSFLSGDPAAKSTYEIIRAYPGFYAIFMYRVAHQLHNLCIPLVPRVLSEYAHSKTGIDIHPAAIIGRSCLIDHGTGVVIGETCIIGDNVKIFQGVTLGALSIDKDMSGIKRHPTVENNVIIYSGATILGGSTVIGEGSIIGGNVWLTKSVPPGTKVYHNADNRVIENIYS